jgi:hypothetical protein
MNTTEKGSGKKETTKKAILKKTRDFFFLSLVMFWQKEKIVIHIGNIRTFNIKAF